MAKHLRHLARCAFELCSRVTLKGSLVNIAVNGYLIVQAEKPKAAGYDVSLCAC